MVPCSKRVGNHSFCVFYGGVMKRREKGFSLIELMIVLVIIGIIAAIGIPNFLDALDRSKQRATVGEIRSWGLAITSYHIEKNRFPPMDASTTAGPIAPLLIPYVISALRPFDSWKNPLHYFTDVSGQVYTISSFGKDGLDTGPLDFVTPLTWQNYDGKIELCDGVFIHAPY